MSRDAALLTAVSVLFGCSFDPVDLSGKGCPCTAGWRCDEASDTCVPREPATVRDAGGEDARSLDAGGGGGPEAGPRDAASPIDAPADAGMVELDAGPDETACDDALADALFCDGFEGPLASSWEEAVEGGTVERTSSPVYRGSWALDGRTTAERERGAVVKYTSLVGSGDLWARGYFYLPSSFDMRALSMLYLHELTSPYYGVAAGMDGPDVAWLWVGPESSSTFGATYTVPRDRWFCLQLHVVVSDTAGSVELRIDGTTVVSETGIDTLPATEYGAFIAGLERSGSTQNAPAQVFADEVAVGLSELPCD